MTAGTLIAMNQTQQPIRQQMYFYDTLKASDHEELTRFINHAAAQGWEPVQCWSDKNAFHPSMAVDHFCLMRRPVDY